MEQTCYRHTAHKAGVTCQRCDKPICPSCMVGASVGFHCPECAGIKRERLISSIPRRQEPRRRPIRRVRELGFAPVSYLIILSNLVIFIFSAVKWGSGLGSITIRQIIRTLGLIGTLPGRCLVNLSDPEGRSCEILGGVSQGEWWRIFTSVFVHYDIPHIFFNMLLLWFVGRELESRLGHTKFLLLYLCSLLGGSFAILAFTPPNILSFGASGAVYGLMGAYVMLSKFHTGRFFNSIVSFILAINLGYSLIPRSTSLSPRSSLEGHLGGLITGLLLGVVFTYLVRNLKNPKMENYIVYGLSLILGGLLFTGSILIA